MLRVGVDAGLGGDLHERLVAGETEFETGARVTPSRSTSVALTVEGLVPQGRTIRARFTYENLSSTTQVAYIWYRRAKADQAWVAEPRMRSFETWGENEPVGSGFTDGAAGPCPVSGQFRLDVFVEGRLVASRSTEVDPGSLGVLLPYEDDILGVSACHPSDWETETTDGGVSFTSPSGALRLSVAAFPLGPVNPPARDAAQTAAIAARAGDRPVVGPFSPFAFGGQRGLLGCFLDQSAGQGRILLVAAALGPDAVVRILEAHAPTVVSNPAEQTLVLNEILSTLRFSTLTFPREELPADAGDVDASLSCRSQRSR